MRPPAALALALSLAAVLPACGGSGSSPRAGTSDAPPLTSAPATSPTDTVRTTAPTTTAAQPQTTAPTTTTSTAPPAATTAPPQASGGAPAGCSGPAGGFIRDVQASGTDCGRARDVASSWFRTVHGGAAPDSQIAAAGYTCSGSLAGERTTVACRGPGGRKIAFTASP